MTKKIMFLMLGIAMSFFMMVAIANKDDSEYAAYQTACYDYAVDHVQTHSGLDIESGSYQVSIEDPDAEDPDFRWVDVYDSDGKLVFTSHVDFGIVDC
jgi:uncharacterized UBP type Zn finger protein